MVGSECVIELWVWKGWNHKWISACMAHKFFLSLPTDYLNFANSLFWLQGRYPLYTAKQTILDSNAWHFFIMLKFSSLGKMSNGYFDYCVNFWVRVHPDSGYLSHMSFFRYLKVQNADSPVPVHPYETLEAQLPSVLLDELHGLLLYIGHLSELPNINLGAFANQNQIKVWIISFNF